MTNLCATIARQHITGGKFTRKSQNQNKNVHLNKFFLTVSVGFLTCVTGKRAKACATFLRNSSCKCGAFWGVFRDLGWVVGPLSALSALAVAATQDDEEGGAKQHTHTHFNTHKLSNSQERLEMQRCFARYALLSLSRRRQERQTKRSKPNEAQTTSN